MIIKPYINIISRKTGSVVSTGLFPEGSVPDFNFKTDMFNFSDVFDFKVGFPKGADVNIKSHDFVEFGYFVKKDNSIKDIESAKYQIGVGYICKFQDSESPTGITFNANGRDLLGRLIDVPFRKSLIVEKQTLTQIFSDICKGEYVESYARMNNRKGFISEDEAYKGVMLYKVSSEQLKGRILQRYTNELALNVSYSDHNGIIVLRGRKKKATSLEGNLFDYGNKKNISNIVVLNDYDSSFSDAVITYSSAEKNVSDANKIGNPIKNLDKRVDGIVDRRLIETINIGEAKDFAGNVDPKSRVNEIANHKIRISNRNLNSIAIQVNLPFVLNDQGQIQFFRVGQFWRINSYRKKFKTSEKPEGVKAIEMLLAGINYSSSVNGHTFELLFVEPDTVC